MKKFIFKSVLGGIVLFIIVVADTKINMNSPTSFCKSVTKDINEFDECIKQLDSISK